MEDNLTILKVEFLSNRLLNHTQILNLNFCQSFKWRQPPMEDDLQILKMEYLSNRLLDHTQIF